MLKRIILVTAIMLIAACAHDTATTAQLETTPRHDEWVTIDSAGRTLHAYVVYPQSSRRSGAVDGSSARPT